MTTKGLEAGAAPRLHERSHRNSKVRDAAAIALCSVALAGAVYCVSGWTRCEVAKSNIAWERCTDNTTFDCAFVDVPFSYDAEIQAELGNRQFSLAVRRLRGHSTKGTILTNPGGPGGSGVDDLLESGPRIARITGGQYDVLSWDPRGVQYTVPALNCTPEWSHSLLAGWSLEELPRPDTVPHGAARAATAARDATIGARADDCIMRTDKAVLESIGTLNTVRDMKRLAEHLGEGDSVKYWGFSYGTTLGATFAMLYPNSIERFVLDGVSHGVKYWQDIFDFSRSTMDSTTAGNDTTSSLLERYERIEARLRDYPISAVLPDTVPGMVSLSSLRSARFRLLYNPARWPAFLEALADLEQGKAERMYRDFGLYTSPEFLEPPHRADKFLHRAPPSRGVPTPAISCPDADDAYDPRVEKRVDELLHFVEETMPVSVTAGDWSMWTQFCQRWPVRARERYTGPFSVKDGLTPPRTPILFLSNRHDPVTPLTAAEAISTALGQNASIVITEGYGHCSYHNPARCTEERVQHYFETGEIEAGICAQEIDIFA